MAQHVECPVCEEKVPLTNASNANNVQCPSCGNAFSNDDTSAQAVEAQPSPTQPPTRLADRATLSPVKPKSPSNDAQANGQPTTSQSGIDSGSTATIQQRYYRRKKNKLLGTMTLYGGLAIAIGVLTGFLVTRLQAPDPEIAQTPDTTPATTEQTDNSSEPEPNKLAAVKPAPKPIEPPPFRVLDRRQANECWEIIRPQLVSLKITGPLGQQDAVGVIVDSRGWIMTSHHAVVGASKIEVTSSARDLDDLTNNEQLTDLVRGVVAMDPDSGLILLEINRRFVVSFRDTEISKTDKLVRGQHLLQCIPPSRFNPLMTTEAKIETRGKLAKLTADQQRFINQRQLNPEIDWVVTRNRADAIPGTPLLTADGTVSAINIFSTNDAAFFVPVTRVEQLVAASDGKTQPLSVLGGSQSQIVGVSEAHPLRSISVKLNRLGKSCKDFDWIPETEAQYEQLQQFTQTFVETIRFTEQEQLADQRQAESIQRQLKKWEDSLIDSMAHLDPSDLSSLQPLNRYSSSRLKQAGKHIPLVGTVFHLSLTRNRIIIKLDGHDLFLNVPIDPAAPPMRPETRWLFFVQTLPSPDAIAFKVGDQTVRTESAILTFGIGPLNQ